MRQAFLVVSEINGDRKLTDLSGKEGIMKKTVLFLLVIFLAALFFSAVQAEDENDLAGTWLSFYSDNDFAFMRISPEDNRLSVILCEGYYSESFKGTYRVEDSTIFFRMQDEDYQDEEYEEEIPFSFADGKLNADFFGEKIFQQVDDRYYPEDPEASPFIGEDKIYWISYKEDGTIQLDGYVGENLEIIEVPGSIFGVPVTSVGPIAFMSHEEIQEVVLPHGITSIGAQVFDSCDNLVSVQLPDTLTEIGYCAFENCHSLEEIVIPEGVTFLDSEVFFNCENLKRITLPESLEEIDSWAFDGDAVSQLVMTVIPGSYAGNYCLENGYRCVTPDDEPARKADDTRTAVETTPDSKQLDQLLMDAEREDLEWTEEFDIDPWGGKLAFAVFDVDRLQLENSFASAREGKEFYGFPADRLAETLDEADMVILVRNQTDEWNGEEWNYARVYQIGWPSSRLVNDIMTDADYVPPAGSEYDPARYYLLMKAEDLKYEGVFDRKAEAPDNGSDYQIEVPKGEEEPVLREIFDGDLERYNEAMALYENEKYYSAHTAFIESGYGNWEEMAEKCVRKWPDTGEIWHDKSQWLQDMELTIVIDQPEDTAMFIRIFKNDAPVSYLFISGPDSITVRLPGNGYYVIKDGVGKEWFGIKEAFGPEGSYETMTFDEEGTEKIYLESNYAYTISINVESYDPDADSIFSETADWSDFVEQE